MKKSEVLQAWSSILAGIIPSLSIEITKEFPLRCPGCYAFDPAHLGSDIQLRQFSDYKSEELFQNELALVDCYKPAGHLFFASQCIGKLWRQITKLASPKVKAAQESPLKIL
ncbi:MAG: Radical domain protein [Edaphobacter sp.]|jgi:hypothetical protein|nr:Radical domain protein [Edaphobacter sp.]